ncbi:MAG: 30S ribosomal protein S16 [Chloroflexi bacterium]|nr:30S ribosomal protein S16 [Chloroflexota bacterium]MBI4506564.1 30S ribosomal protein S16 [Chloroflexota bacterium]
MPVRIRLRRVGAKKKPLYRLVVADSRSPRDGRFIETVGHYNPRTDPPSVQVDLARVTYWIEHGAQPSEAAGKILRRAQAAVAAGEAATAEPAAQG